MDLIISKQLVIPSKEIKWRFSKSSGNGGQKVNKVESKVEIIFNIEDSKVLNDHQKKKLKIKLRNKLVHDSLCLVAQEHRHQYLNRQLAALRMSALLNKTIYNSNKLRKHTKPSKVSQQKRIELKRYRGELKKNRKSEKFYQII